jgi:ABC-type Fe3+-siderophore transport system permease subunit
MGADAATSLGVDVPRLRRNLSSSPSLIAGLSVAVAGQAAAPDRLRAPGGVS